MTSEVNRSVEKNSLDNDNNDTCRKLINLGYARQKRVRLYGQELQIVSDPFPHDDGGIAVEVIGKSELDKRTMRLPLTVVQVARKPEKRSA